MARGMKSQEGRRASSEYKPRPQKDTATTLVGTPWNGKMDAIDSFLERSAFKINANPSTDSIKDGEVLKEAIEGASDALKIARSAVNETEGYSTGNPDSKFTKAHIGIRILTDETLSQLVKEMTLSAKSLDAYWQKDIKKQAEYREEMEYFGIQFEDLQKKYEKDASAVINTITRIREVAMRNKNA